MIILAEAANFTCSIARLCRVARLRYSPLRSLVYPAAAAFLAAAGVRALLPIDPATIPLPWLFAEVVFMLAVYAGLLALTGAVRRLVHRRDDRALDII